MNTSDFRINGSVLLKYCGKGGDLVVPAGITEIQSGAFTRCRGLTSVVLPEGLVKIGDYSFRSCICLKKIALPKSLQEIKKGAFKNCSALTEAILPKKLILLDCEAFHGCIRQDDNGNNKGSIQMLEEWLCANTTAKAEDIQRVIISPLKKIRKIRQLPAHELASNEYNKKYYTDQFGLVDAAYCSLASIRNLLYSNPAAKRVKIPDYLIDGTKIVNY